MIKSASFAWRMTPVLLLLSLLFMGCNAVLGPRGEKKAGGSGASVDGQLQCSVGTVDCAGTCVSTASSDSHCGGCGLACAPGQYCEGGVCSEFCASGSLDCGGQCAVTSSDLANCGGCGVACALGQYCDGGACMATCSGSLCTNASAQTVCAHLESNNEHCGACGVLCGLGKTCQAGVCVASCAEGRQSCGGACVDVRSDSQNCGGCGLVCAQGVSCVEGACGGSTPVCTGTSCACGTGKVDCNGACIDTQVNALHCGACGKQCQVGQVCAAGSCECAGAGTLCSAGCTDTMTDNANCGACGKVCTGGTSCMAGICECEDGKDICSETCVDMQVDPNNCGACGKGCESYESCVEGICKYDADQCGGEARNIDITRVALYQGVENDLYVNGALLSKAERNVDVIQNRDAYVRVFVAPQNGFSARELSARLFVENEGGDIQVFFQKKTVTSASTQQSLSSTFGLDVPGEVLKATTKYWIELAECGLLPDGTVGVTRVPQTSGINADMSARQTGVVKVTFVPLSHDGRVPDTSQQNLAEYIHQVEMQYPTVAVEATVRSPVNSNQSGIGIDLGYTLDQITDLRSSDNPADDVYYYGIIDPASSVGQYCGGGCTTGMGWVPDVNGWGAVDHRAAVGVGFGTWGAGTFVHELGHNQGRNHAPCGGASGADQSYPHNNAEIGSWGFDLSEKQLIEPSHKDFMSYCDPTWVSDYTFRALVNRIAAVNGAPSSNIVAPPPTGPMQEWYRMLVTSSGAKWAKSVVGPGAPGTKAEQGTIFDATGNVLALVDVYRVVMSERGGYMLYVPAPQKDWYAVGGPGSPILAY